MRIKDYLCEEIRNEKIRTMKNPFKFGSAVDGVHFTDRADELRQVLGVLSSDNHLIVISPRRYGKTSLVLKAVSLASRPSIIVNLQAITSPEELGSMMLKRLFKLFPYERIKHLVKHFRFIPTLSVNPMTDGVDVTFQPTVDTQTMLEDVLSLVDELGEKQKLIVVMDEFQDIVQIGKDMDKRLRSIMQLQRHVNYVFLGSEESMMEEIFERKRSPFYHFGLMMRLKKIPWDDFKSYVESNLRPLAGEESGELAGGVLSFTRCHPYYTQQLSFQVWNKLEQGDKGGDIVSEAVSDLTEMHDYDYERLWVRMNKTDKKVMMMLARGERPLDSSSPLAASTAFSAVKRLVKQGYVVKDSTYEIDDPFFANWIVVHTS